MIQSGSVQYSNTGSDQPLGRDHRVQQPLAYLFPMSLVVLSTVLLALHVRKWRRLEEYVEDDEQQHFYRRQLRRRLQASAMIGLLGIAIAGGMAIPWQHWPLAFAFYWLLVILVTFWIALLALADMSHSRAYVNRLNREHRIKRAELEAQLARFRARQSNGKHD